jgi:hypothetical protein
MGTLYTQSGQGSVSTAEFGVYNCSTTEQVHNWVYIVDTADKTVAQAQADDYATVISKGIIIRKPSPTTCIVQMGGIVEMTGLVRGKLYFLSPFVPGGMQTAVPQTGSGHFVRPLGQSLSTTEFLIDKDPVTTKRR